MSFKVISGNIPGDVTFKRDKKGMWNPVEFYLLKYDIIKFMKKSEHVDLDFENNLYAITRITEDNQKSFAGKAGWGLAGAMVLGPLGMLAGVLAGGNKKVAICAIEVAPAYKFVAEIDFKALTEMQTMASKNRNRGLKFADSDLVKIAPTPAPAPAPQPATNGWTCVCGHTNTGKFCAQCGKPKAEPKSQEKQYTLDDLLKFKQLLDAGAITEEEYAELKAKVLK